MNFSKSLMTVAALGAFVAGAALMVPEAHAAKEGYEKCAGIVKAGQNDCGANGHLRILQRSRLKPHYKRFCPPLEVSHL